nr:WD40 repeat domain containing protein [Haemonchus contortus]
MKLTPGTVQHFVCAKKFSENSMRINSVDYSSDGLTMITSSDDDSIFIYSMQTGTRTRNVNSKKYGVDLIKFSHNTSNAIHCSTKVDDTIRYLSLHDNKYIRYFPGHTKKVMCLSMNPIDDTFLSGSLDKTIRLWDLRSQNCQGLMQVNGKAIAAFDPEGLIFAAGINNEQVKLYDLRSFDKGPFTTFKLEAERSCEWTGMTFSPCGKYIMINTNGTLIRLIDAFTGNLKVTFEGHRNDQQEALEASFSPDSQFVFCGSSDRCIHAWCTETGKRVATFETEHDAHLRIVSWNPKHFMVASACTKLCFWIPGDEVVDN